MLLFVILLCWHRKLLLPLLSRAAALGQAVSWSVPQSTTGLLGKGQAWRAEAVAPPFPEGIEDVGRHFRLGNSRGKGLEVVIWN